MRPCSRKFKAELDGKVERLAKRLVEAERGDLAAGQNPGFDRLAEAYFLQGKWDDARSTAARAVEYWKTIVGKTADGPAMCEPIFHLGSAHLFADDLSAARETFTRAVGLYASNGLAGSDDTGYMAVVSGDLRRARAVFLAASVADMGAQGMSDLAKFEARFPDTPRLLKLRFAEGVERRDASLLSRMALMERWLTPEPEGISSFRTEEWFYAAHQTALAQIERGEPCQFRLYDEAVAPGLRVK